MKYQIGICQAGGARSYLASEIEFAAPPADAPVKFITKAGVKDEWCTNIKNIMHRCFNYQMMVELVRRKFGPGSVGVEIGVDYGDGIARMLEAEPSEISAVDPWLVDTTDAWTNTTQEEMDARYKFVNNRFSCDGRVLLYTMKSSEFYGLMFPEYADWAYVDGDHSEEGCYADIVGCYGLLKQRGYIFVDDVAQSGLGENIEKAISRALADLPGMVRKTFGLDPAVLEVKKS